MRKQEFQIDKDALYVAWQGAALTVDGAPFAFPAGTRLRGSHAAVQTLGSKVFVPDGTPPNEWPSPYADVRADWAPDERRSFRIQTLKLKATRDVSVAVDGVERKVKRDDYLEPNDPLGLLLPDAFEKVMVDR